MAPSRDTGPHQGRSHRVEGHHDHPEEPVVHPVEGEPRRTGQAGQADVVGRPALDGPAARGGEGAVGDERQERGQGLPGVAVLAVGHGGVVQVVGHAPVAEDVLHGHAVPLPGDGGQVAGHAVARGVDQVPDRRLAAVLLEGVERPQVGLDVVRPGAAPGDEAVVRVAS